MRALVTYRGIGRQLLRFRIGNAWSLATEFREDVMPFVGRRLVGTICRILTEHGQSELGRILQDTCGISLDPIPALCLMLPSPIALAVVNGSVSILVFPSPFGVRKCAKFERNAFSTELRRYSDAVQLPLPTQPIQQFRLKDVSSVADDSRDRYHGYSSSLSDSTKDALYHWIHCILWTNTILQNIDGPRSSLFSYLAHA